MGNVLLLIGSLIFQSNGREHETALVYALKFWLAIYGYLRSCAYRKFNSRFAACTKQPFCFTITLCKEYQEAMSDTVKNMLCQRDVK